MRYDKKIDKKWQDYWQNEGIFSVDVKDKSRPKYYCLVMFPYPSSELHVGHARNYVIGDAVARYKMMRGYNVLSPMGWDAFGLPAENQAIKHKIHPKEWTFRNINRIKEQLNSWGVGYDWRREVTTCVPDYYKWTQWIFLKLYKKGLAYRKEALVNWCPSCKTVLANEQVISGSCERCGTAVEQKKLKQWFFKITDYAERLLDDIDKLDDWPERVKVMQRNWIGKSEGVEINFSLENSDRKIKCFTTRVDTIFGATFIALSWNHPLVSEFISESSEGDRIKAFVEKVKNQPLSARMMESFEKSGVFTGKYAVNPMNNKRIPIWIANYILAEYGTGAIMCVPAHDSRDFEFASKYDLPIIEVIRSSKNTALQGNKMEQAYEGEGFLVNSGEFNGLSSTEAKSKIASYMEEHNIGRKVVNYKLRDWLISRQRYWGVPIPMVYCDKCGEVPVEEKDLPVLLPEVKEFLPTGQSPLTYINEFIETRCPKCGAKARRETDTMDTFVDSSWYFLRYISPDRDDIPFVSEDVNRWLPVDQYIGGVEHAILHLMYARFINKFLKDIGLINFSEPFARLFTQGMIVKEGAKMSKSKGNVVSPDYIIDKYGADTMRLYILFIGPPHKDAEWQDEGLGGAWRFINRVLKLIDIFNDYPDKREDSLSNSEKVLLKKMHSTIKDVTLYLEGNFQFNTAVSKIMELVNQFYKSLGEGGLTKRVFHDVLETVFLLLAPFTPHISEEANSILGHNSSVFKRKWPKFDESYLKEEEVEIAVLINGRVRGHMNINVNWDEERIKKEAVSLDKIKDVLSNKHPKKIIYVDKKIVNIVA